MNQKQLSETMADALEQIAGMPCVDHELNLSRESIINQYHEALTIARDALAYYTANRASVCDMDCNTCLRPLCTGAKALANEKARRAKKGKRT